MKVTGQRSLLIDDPAEAVPLPSGKRASLSGRRCRRFGRHERDRVGEESGRSEEMVDRLASSLPSTDHSGVDHSSSRPSLQALCRSACARRRPLIHGKSQASARNRVTLQGRSASTPGGILESASVSRVVRIQRSSVRTRVSARSITATLRLSERVQLALTVLHPIDGTGRRPWERVTEGSP